MPSPHARREPRSGGERRTARDDGSRGERGELGADGFGALELGTPRFDFGASSPPFEPRVERRRGGPAERVEARDVESGLAVKEQPRGAAQCIVAVVDQPALRAARVLERLGARLGEEVGEHEVGVGGAAAIAGAFRARRGVERRLAGLVNGARGRVTRRHGERGPRRLDAATECLEEQQRAACSAQRLAELTDDGRRGRDAREVRRFFEHGTGARGVLRRGTERDERSLRIASPVKRVAAYRFDSGALLVGTRERARAFREHERRLATTGAELGERTHFEHDGRIRLGGEQGCRGFGVAAVEHDARGGRGGPRPRGSVNALTEQRARLLFRAQRVASAARNFRRLRPCLGPARARRYRESAAELAAPGERPHQGETQRVGNAPRLDPRFDLVEERRVGRATLESERQIHRIGFGELAPVGGTRCREIDQREGFGLDLGDERDELFDELCLASKRRPRPGGRRRAHERDEKTQELVCAERLDARPSALAFVTAEHGHGTRELERFARPDE